MFCTLSLLVCAIRLAISRARPVAVLSESSNNVEKRCRRWPKSSARVSSVETSAWMLLCRCAIVSSVRRLAPPRKTTAPANGCPPGGERAAARPELAEDFRRSAIEVTKVLFDLGRGGSAFAAQIGHRADEFGDPRCHRMLDRAHVFMSAAEHLLQQDVSFTQPLEQGGRIGAQHRV